MQTDARPHSGSGTELGAPTHSSQPPRPTRRSPGGPCRRTAYGREKPGRNGEPRQGAAPSRGRVGAAMAAGSSPGGSGGRRGHFLCRAADGERWRKPRRPLLGVNSSARAPAERRASLTGSWTPSHSFRRRRLRAVGKQLGAPPYVVAARGGATGSSRRVARRDRRLREGAPRADARACREPRAARAGDGGDAGRLELRAPRTWLLGTDATSSCVR